MCAGSRRNPLTYLHLCLLISFLSASALAGSGKQVVVYKTVSGHEIHANLFLPKDTEGPFPTVVYFHGGFFIWGNRDHALSNEFRQSLLSHKIAVVSADYRLAPETKLDGIMEDASDLLRWLRSAGSKDFDLDPNKIAVAGSSAGGYLALTTGFDPECSPNAIITISVSPGFTDPGSMGDVSILDEPGPYDVVGDSMISYGDYKERRKLMRFLAKNKLFLYSIFGFDPSEEPDALKKFRLQENIHSDFPPTLLIHARNDRAIPMDHVERLHRIMKEKGCASELHIVENGHGEELIKLNPESADRMISFLQDQAEF